MHPSQNSDEIIRLASKVLDEIITDEEFARLEDLLSASGSNRKVYLDLMQLESLIHWEQESDPGQIKENSRKIIPFPFLPWVSSMAAVLVALLAGWWNFSHTSSASLFTELAFKPTFASEESAHLEVAELGSPAGAPSADPISSRSPDKLLSYKPEGGPLYMEEVISGIEMLKNRVVASEFGQIEKVGPVHRLSRMARLSIPTEHGVLPASGSEMVAMSQLSVDVESQSASTMNMIQILDLRDMATNLATGEVYLNVEAQFNQSFSASQEGAEFALAFHALKGEGRPEEDGLGYWESTLQCDIDPKTWEPLISGVNLPSRTEFVVISVNVRKSGPDALLANASRYYTDDITVSLNAGNPSSPVSF
jgi:hypothetical protein